MIIWIPAIGLLVFGIFGLAGGEIRLTRRKTLRGQQAKIVGVICLAGAVVISPVGIMTMASLIDDSGRSQSRAATAAGRTTDPPSSSNFVPPPPPPPAPPAPRQTESPTSSNSAPPASPQPSALPTPPTRRQTDWTSSSISAPPLSPQPFAPPTRQRVVIFDVLSYDGQADASEAARAALQHVRWAVATDVEADLDAQQVIIPVRSPSLSTVFAKTALEQVGFQIGGVKLTWREVR